MPLYIAERERLAIKKYKSKNTPTEKKDQLYKEIIYPAFKKLVDFLMMKHNQKINDPYSDVRNDCISHLTDIIEKYDPKKPAFNFFNLCARNYILQECVVKKNKKVSIVQAYRKDTNEALLGTDENLLGKKSVVDERFIDNSYKDIFDDNVSDFYIHLKKQLKKIMMSTEGQNERLFLDNILMILESKDHIDINNKKELYIILRTVTNFKSREITKYTTKLKQYYKEIAESYFKM